jgi:hypothetical protein
MYLETIEDGLIQFWQTPEDYEKYRSLKPQVFPLDQIELENFPREENSLIIYLEVLQCCSPIEPKDLIDSFLDTYHFISDDVEVSYESETKATATFVNPHSVDLLLTEIRKILTSPLE